MRKRLISILLVLCIAVALMPSTYAYSGKGYTLTVTSIKAKIDELYEILGGTYFNVEHKATGCGSSYASDHGLGCCSLANIVKQTWFKNLFGTLSTSNVPSSYGLGSTSYTRSAYSCVGFAHFAEWYIFNSGANTKVDVVKVGDYSYTYENMKKYARSGDILRFDNSHSAIIYSVTETGVNVLDCNWPADYNGKVAKHKIAYTKYNKVAISREEHQSKKHTNYFYGNFSGKNYIIDTDFTSTELDTENWVNKDDTVSAISVDTVETCGGYNSLRLDNFAPGGTDSKYLSVGTITQKSQQHSGFCGDNRSFTLSFWAKSSNAGTTLRFGWGYESHGAYRAVTLTNQWQKYTVPMNKELIFSKWIHIYAEQAGSVWLAQLQLEDGTTATDFVPEHENVYMTKTYTEGNTYSLPDPPSRPGYTFDGWFNRARGGTQITSETGIKTLDYCLYAHWTALLSITGQPDNARVNVGETAVFSVEAQGPGLTYQWYYRTTPNDTWTAVSAASGKTSNYSLTTAARHNGYQYYCRVTSDTGEYMDSETVTLTVVTVPPVITAQPSNVTKTVGQTASFKVSATGATGYQWYYRTPSNGAWTAVSASSGKTATYTLTVAERHNGYQYRCKVTNSADSVYSDIVTLTVNSKPVITAQPSNVTVAEGNTATFKVSATGATSYQWYYSKDNGTTWTAVSAASGKTSTYSLTTAARHNGYRYYCKVTNSNGSANSATVTLTVNS